MSKDNDVTRKIILVMCKDESRASAIVDELIELMAKLNQLPKSKPAFLCVDEDGDEDSDAYQENLELSWHRRELQDKIDRLNDELKALMIEI